jgi:hypothetical protein
MSFLKNIFGGGKPAFKPVPHQTVEIEFEDVDGNFQSYFVEILEAPKRRLTLATPGNDMNPVQIGPGQPVTISYFDPGKNALFSFAAQVRDSRDQEFDVDLPKEIPHTDVPARDENFRAEVAIPVKYQAVRSVHSQVANTHAITPNSLFLKTNLAIPPETPLRVVLEIPNAPHIDVTARAKGSEKDPADNRKHISEVQFEEIGFDEKESILSYAVYYEARNRRAESRGQ